MKPYISYLRIMCAISVILVHVSAYYVGQFDSLPTVDWEIANFIDAILRFGVPVFLMITGAVFLNKTENLSIFLRKRAKRILLPLLFWASFYFIINNYQKFGSANPLLVLKNLGLYIYQGASQTHLWYLYMIIPIYLFIPILQKWTISASKKEIIYFLSIWGIYLFITKQTAPYFPSITLTYFSTYIGYIVLGHFLDKYFNDKTRKFALIACCLYLFGALFTYGITSFLSHKYDTLIRNFYWASTPNVALAATGIFLWVKSISSEKSRSFWNTIQSLSFGVYFIHIFVFVKLQKFLNLYTVDQPITLLFHIILMSLLIYIISLGIIFLLKKIPVLKSWVC